MTDPNPETLSADDIRKLVAERDQLRSEVARLTAILDRNTARVDLLKEASCQALEYIVSPNPYCDHAQLRKRAILHMEDALEVNGIGIAKFDVRSDAN